MRGDACVEHLETQGVTRLRQYPDYRSVIESALTNSIAYFCMDVYPARFYIHRAGAGGRFHMALELYQGRLHRAVREGDSATRQVVEAGLARLSDEELDALLGKWLPPPTVTAPWARHVGAIAAGIGLSAALLVAWLLATRAAVKRRTAELRETQGSLARRVREQQCLHDVFRLTEELSKPVPRMIADVARALRTGFGAESPVAVSVEVDGERCVTSTPPASAESVGADITIDGQRRGRVTVSALALPEEAAELIEEVAARIAATLARATAARLLHESEERFRRLFEDSRQATLLFEEGRVVVANQAALELIGAARLADVAGLGVAELSPERQPDGTPSATGAQAWAERARRVPASSSGPIAGSTARYSSQKYWSPRCARANVGCCTWRGPTSLTRSAPWPSSRGTASSSSKSCASAPRNSSSTRCRYAARIWNNRRFSTP
jgi:PAS domain-containing protein